MFNEKKYKNCIGHLISQKAFIIFIYLLIFAIIGFGIGFGISDFFDGGSSAIIGVIVGAILGLILGIFSTWRIEMKIQEAYWRIDMLNEFKKNNNTLSTELGKVSKISSSTQTVKEEKDTKPISEIKEA